MFLEKSIFKAGAKKSLIAHRAGLQNLLHVYLCLRLQQMIRRPIGDVNDGDCLSTGEKLHVQLPGQRAVLHHRLWVGVHLLRRQLQGNVSPQTPGYLVFSGRLFAASR